MARNTNVISLEYKKFLFPNNLKELNLIFGISLLFSVVLSYLLIDFLHTGKQKYTDIIIGSITWQDFYKSFDYLIVISFISIFFISWFVTLTLIHYLKKDNYNSRDNANFVEMNKDPLQGLVFGLLLYSIALWTVRGDFPESEFLVTGIIVILGFFVGNKSEKQNSQYRNIISLILSIVFLYFSVIGILIFIKFIDPSAFVSNPLLAKSLSFWVISIATIIGILLLIQNKLTNRIWRKFIYISQFTIPLLLLVYIKGSYQQQNTIIFMNVPTHTMILVYVIIGACLLFNLKVIYNNRKLLEDGTLSSLILTPTLFSLAVFMAYRIPSYSALTSDDFHLGEIIIPWHQIFQLNQSMFSEFVSVQGLMGIIYGGINDFFFAGSASSFPLAISLFYTTIAGISIVLLSRLLGNTWGLIFTISLLPTSDRYFIVLPLLLILSSPKLISRPVIWLIVWMLLSLFHCFYNPSVGAALTAVTIPIAIWMLIQAYSSGGLKEIWVNKKGTLIAYFASSIVLLGILSPSIFGLIGFLLDNGSANTNAYGISYHQALGLPSWFPLWFSSHFLNYLFWETIRIGGWLIGIIAIWYCINRFHVRINMKDTLLNKESIFSTYIFGLLSIAFVVAMIPYSMGRIDPGALSRPGSVSLIALSILLPIILILSNRLNKWGMVIPGIIGLLIGIHSSFSYQDPADLAVKAIQPIIVPEYAQYVQGTEIGLPNLGDIYIEPAKIEDINNFKLTMDMLLKGKETYFDLTNRSLYYYLIDKKVPSIYSADYLAANYEIQTKMISALNEEKPSVVWIGPSIRHDGGPSSLRSYRIYRWLMKGNYQYYEKNGFQFLLREDRYQEILNSEMKDMDNGNVLPSLIEWTERYSFGEKQIINPYALKVKKEVLGWYHNYVTIPVMENQKYIYTMDTVISDHGRTYVYVEFYGENNNKVGEITSPFIESSQSVDFWLTAPQGTTRMEFGLIIDSESEGTFEFNNIKLLHAEGQIATDPELRDIYNGKSLGKVFHQKNLQSIPIAWGRNLSYLKQRFDKDEYGSDADGVKLVLKHDLIESSRGFDIKGEDPFLVWNIANGLNGSEFDFVEIKLNTDTNNLFRGQVYWSETGSEFSEDNSFVFNAQKGTLLIPLGSHPNWLTSNNITTFRFDIDGYSGKEIQASYKFLKLVK